MGSSETSAKVEVIQYLVDCRRLWPAAVKTADLATHAMRALTLLTDEERVGVMKYYFVADAKMALVSRLLKHWVVSRYAGIPWEDTQMSCDKNKKPIFVDKNGKQPVVFNVSHQAGLVALVAVTGYEHGEKGAGDNKGVEIGTDIVCTSEREKRDLQIIRSEPGGGGWGKFVDMHADVFGREEAGYLTTEILRRPTFTSLPSEMERLYYKLRAFYMLWCLREAYVKMTGEALLAEWLGDLVFRDFEPPAPQGMGVFAQTENDDGEKMVVRTFDVAFKGKRVEDANICLRSLGRDYMTCTAVRTPRRPRDALGWTLGPYKFLDIEEVIGLGEEGVGP